MHENISNRNGKALEYRIIDFLVASSDFNITLTQRATEDQRRDAANYSALPGNLQQSYDRCSEMVCNWLLGEIDTREIRIDRLSDQDARKGDITDIKISSADKEINLSIKHNHTALKHQRPPTTALQCGYREGSAEDVAFRKGYESILNRFLKRARVLNSEAVYFRDLKIQDKLFIEVNLYHPVCDLVCKTINELCKGQLHTQALFKFLVGNSDFFKILDYSDRVEILDFHSVGLPKTVIASRKKSNYVVLSFSNKWVIKMRLHTASSALGRSLKFDTQPLQIPEVPKIILDK